MAYLSRVWLNPLRTGTQRMLRNPQVTHAVVLGCLSRQPVDERVLWRLDDSAEHRLALLVLTQSSPSFESLVEQAGWPTSDEPQALSKPYDALLARVVRGREFAFRVRANTVTASRDAARWTPRQAAAASEQRRRGVLVPERTVAAQTEWFAQRAHRWGFDVVESAAGHAALELVDRSRLSFGKSGSSARVVLQTATFEGRLRVTDPAVMSTSLLQGVGRGRAYGCGLLTLAHPGGG